MLSELGIVSIVKCRRKKKKKEIKKSVKSDNICFLMEEGKRKKEDCTDDMACSALCMIQSSQQDTVCLHWLVQCFYSYISSSVVHSAHDLI